MQKLCRKRQFLFFRRLFPGWIKYQAGLKGRRDELKIAFFTFQVVQGAAEVVTMTVGIGIPLEGVILAAEGIEITIEDITTDQTRVMA